MSGGKHVRRLQREVEEAVAAELRIRNILLATGYENERALAEARAFLTAILRQPRNLDNPAFVAEAWTAAGFDPVAPCADRPGSNPAGGARAR